MLCKKTFNDSMDDILCKLMKKGAQINFKGEFGITPLMMACYFNDIELLSFLIGQNAKLDITNEDGDTPLSIAAYFNNAEIVKALVKQKPNEKNHKKNNYNESPLTIAETMGNKEIIDILRFYFEVDEEESDSIESSDEDDSYYSSFDEGSSEDEGSGNGIEEENCKIMSDKLEEKIKKILFKSVCSIKVTCNNNKEMCGTGFLVKLIIPSKENPLYGLITDDYVLTSEYLQSNSSFEVLLNNKTLKINLNNNKIIFTSELIGITFIQLTKLTDEKFFNDPDIDFLSPDTEKFDANDVIILTQDQSLSFESINYLSGFNYNLTTDEDEGLPGSPLFNYDFYSNNIKVLGVYKRGNVATSFNIIEEVIRMIYNKRYIYEINRARENPRVLNDNEIEELINHKLEETKLNNVFKCPYLELNKSVFFYKSNHGWYCTIRKNIKYDKENLKNYDWTFINPYEPIEKIIEKIGKGKLEHRHEVIIMWLKLSEFKYI